MTSTIASFSSYWRAALIALLLLRGPASAAPGEESTLRVFLAHTCKSEVARMAKEIADAHLARLTPLGDEKTRESICACVEEQLSGDMVMGTMLDATPETADRGRSTMSGYNATLC